MKTIQRLLLTLVLLFLFAYSVATTIRVRDLEVRLCSVEFAQRAAVPLTVAHDTQHPISYAFDDSFVRYFGQEGVAKVERILKGATTEGAVVEALNREW